MIGLAGEIRTVELIQPLRIVGRVEGLRGLTVLVGDLPMPVGSVVRVGAGTAGGRFNGMGEVVGFDGAHAIVMMLGGTQGIKSGDRVEGLQAMQSVGVGESLIGRVIDGLGRPIDGKGPLKRTMLRPIDAEPLAPLSRARVKEPVYTGVRAVDLMTTLGRGQRMGIFAGPGVGKSTLLGDIAKRSSTDVSVIGLIGERGREVKDFIEQSLGPEGLSRSVVVVATGDESPLMRTRAALVACAAAEHFRDAGKDVMLIMDSVTRFAQAQRQIGLSAGEPPATRGYTPSVFASMSRMLERAGAAEDEAGAKGGSITGIYSVLVEGDDMTEPVADAARGILDGHIILRRELAQRGHYPAIDVLDSVSRVATEVCDEAHTAARQQIVRLLARYKEVEDLVQIGAYAKGSNPVADVALKYVEPINEMLRQGRNEQPAPGGAKVGFEQTRSRMVKLAIEAGGQIAQLTAAQGGGSGGRKK